MHWSGSPGFFPKPRRNAQKACVPPVAEGDLEELREAVRPYEVPQDLVTLLMWADGQSIAGWWLPSINCGPLLSAKRAAEFYTWLCKETESWQWNPLWLPIAHEQWYQAGMEMTTDRPPVLIDASFPDPQVRVIAPSLAAALHGTADLIEAGLPLRPRNQSGPAWEEWDAQRREIVAARNDREGWSNWRYDRWIASDPRGWPPHWRAAVGLPPETEYPHPPARPIGVVLAQAKKSRVEATVEGYVRDMTRLDKGRDSRWVITLVDDTGLIPVFVGSKTPGREFVPWVNRRIQLDLVAGSQANDEVQASLVETSLDPRESYAVAAAARLGVQV